MSAFFSSRTPIHFILDTKSSPPLLYPDKFYYFNAAQTWGKYSPFKGWRTRGKFRWREQRGGLATPPLKKILSTK